MTYIGRVLIALGIVGICICVGLGCLLVYLLGFRGKEVFLTESWLTFVPIVLVVCVLVTVCCLGIGVACVRAGSKTTRSLAETKDVPPIGRRPPIITILCTLGFVGGILGLLVTFLIVVWPHSLEGNRQRLLVFYPILSTLTLAVVIGYWKMRRWGVYLYGGVLLMGITGSVLMHSMNLLGFVFPLAFLIVGLVYFKRMI